MRRYRLKSPQRRKPGLAKPMTSQVIAAAAVAVVAITAAGPAD
jgi:hypothetical protein